MTARARAKFRRLKKVNTFSQIICPSLFVCTPESPLCRPCFTRCSTCRGVSPSLGSG